MFLPKLWMLEIIHQCIHYIFDGCDVISWRIFKCFVSLKSVQCEMKRLHKSIKKYWNYVMNRNRYLTVWHLHFTRLKQSSLIQKIFICRNLLVFMSSVQRYVNISCTIFLLIVMSFPGVSSNAQYAHCKWQQNTFRFKLLFLSTCLSALVPPLIGTTARVLYIFATYSTSRDIITPSCVYNVIRMDGESLSLVLQKVMNVLAVTDIILLWPVGGWSREVRIL